MIISPSQRVQQVQSYYFARKLAEIAEMNRSGKPVINLGIGSPDLLPPEHVVKELQSSAEHTTANKYQSYRGIPALRQAFADWYIQQYNVKLDPQSEVLPLMGSKEGIMHITMSFLDPGDQVLIPNPGYPAYALTAKLAGATPVNYNLNESTQWIPSIEELEKIDLRAVKLMWINYPHMPTGAVANAGVYQELIDFARRNQILLCHDNPYSFILNENPTSILEYPGAKDVCIELNSLSKCFNMASWRVGVMLANKSYIDTVMRFKSNMDSGMYKPIQMAAIQALSSPPSWYEQINAVYAKRKKLGIELMEMIDCEVNEGAAGFFIWAKMKEDSSSAHFVDEILQESRVFLTPGIIFGTNGEGYIRLSLCNSEADIQAAMDRIEKYIAKRKLVI